MKINDTEYTEIQNFPGYFISTLGVVVSTKPGRNCFKGQVKYLNPVVNSKGYLQYCMINHNKQKKSPMQHQLLMRTFVANPENHPHINHIDGVKTNNSLSNLEWCSPLHNVTHARETGLTRTDYCHVPVHKYDLSGKYVESFASIAQASRETGSPSASIVNSAKGTIKASLGFMFSYEKVDSMTPYDGAPVTKSIEVEDLLTREVLSFKTLAQVSIHTGLHRSKFLRRFKSKGLSFIIENFKITKTIH